MTYTSPVIENMKSLVNDFVKEGEKMVEKLKEPVEMCDWCGERDNLHICGECHTHILDVTCHKYQGLCPECYEKWGI